MANQQPTTPSAGDQVVNALKFVADTALMPGSSQLVEGKIGAGVMYAIAGVASRAFLGPWFWVGVGLDSFSLSASGKHLWEHIISSGRSELAPQEQRP